jgi:hypothetical protein
VALLPVLLGDLSLGVSSNINTKKNWLMAAEGTGDTLSLITWVAFGSSVVVLAFRQPTWQALVYRIINN